jgi:hypothetical protein
VVVYREVFLRVEFFGASEVVSDRAIDVTDEYTEHDELSCLEALRLAF